MSRTSRTSVWHRIPLRVQGFLLNSLPLIAVLLSAGFAFISNQQRERMEISMSRHFELVVNLVDLQTALLAAEAGLRGELLTDSAEFLEPYEAALDMIPKDTERIRTIIESVPRPNRRAEKRARFDHVERLVNGQLKALAALKEGRQGSAGAPALSQAEVSMRMARNWPLMDEACKQLGALRADEQRLLSKRLEESKSVRHRDYLLIFLSVLVGLGTRAVAMYFFHRRVVRRVRQLTENVRSLRDGSIPIHEPTGHADDIGELERELARIGDFLAERRMGS